MTLKKIGFLKMKLLNFQNNKSKKMNISNLKLIISKLGKGESS